MAKDGLDQPSDAEGSDDKPSNDREAMRKEREMLDQRSRTLQHARRTPTVPPADLSEQELARRLIYDMIATQARAEVVIQASIDLIEPHLDELRRANQLRRAEYAQKERELAQQAKAAEREEAAEVRRYSVVERAFGGIGAIAATMFRNKLVVSAVASAIGTLITTLLATWGIGGFEHMIPPEVPPP